MNESLNFPFIRLLYYVGKVYGYMPIRYKAQPPKAYSSIISIIYSILYAIFLTISLPLLQYRDFKTIQDFVVPNSTLLIVVGLNYLIIGCRSVLGSIQQVFNRNRFIGLINEGYQLNAYVNVIRNEESKENLESIDKKCANLLNVKMVSVFFQLIIMFDNIITDYSNGRGLVAVLLMVLNTHGINILTTSTYFCAMIVTLRFYYLLNRRLKSSMERIGHVEENDKEKTKIFRNISDDIDRIDRLYDKISLFACKINNFYSFQLLLAIITSFGYALSGVSLIYIFLETFTNPT